MLKFTYDDILKDNKQNKLTTLNHFLDSSTPRQLPKLLRKKAKSLWFQKKAKSLWFQKKATMLWFLIFFSVIIVVVPVILSFAEDAEKYLFTVFPLIIFALVSFSIGAVCWWRNAFIFTLKHGVLKEGIILGMKFLPQYHYIKKGAYLYVEFTNKCGQCKVKKVFIDDSKIDVFKKILDSEEKPKIDLLEYKKSIAVPLIFCI